MTTKIVKPGDKEKQGDAVCPRCGEVVLIGEHYGDLPKCPHCDVPYSLRPPLRLYS